MVPAHERQVLFSAHAYNPDSNRADNEPRFSGLFMCWVWRFESIPVGSRIQRCDVWESVFMMMHNTAELKRSTRDARWQR